MAKRPIVNPKPAPKKATEVTRDERVAKAKDADKPKHNEARVDANDGRSTDGRRGVNTAAAEHHDSGHDAVQNLGKGGKGIAKPGSDGGGREGTANDAVNDAIGANGGGVADRAAAVLGNSAPASVVDPALTEGPPTAPDKATVIDSAVAEVAAAKGAHQTAGPMGHSLQDQAAAAGGPAPTPSSGAVASGLVSVEPGTAGSDPKSAQSEPALEPLLTPDEIQDEKDDAEGEALHELRRTDPELYKEVADLNEMKAKQAAETDAQYNKLNMEFKIQDAQKRAGGQSGARTPDPDHQFDSERGRAIADGLRSRLGSRGGGGDGHTDPISGVSTESSGGGIAPSGGGGGDSEGSSAPTFGIGASAEDGGGGGSVATSPDGPLDGLLSGDNRGGDVADAPATGGGTRPLDPTGNDGAIDPGEANDTAFGGGQEINPLAGMNDPAPELPNQSADEESEEAPPALVQEAVLMTIVEPEPESTSESAETDEAPATPEDAVDD